GHEDPRDRALPAGQAARAGGGVLPHGPRQREGDRAAAARDRPGAHQAGLPP
ncbi:unnamed protein product, partial [Heterosigma akashiwo]